MLNVTTIKNGLVIDHIRAGSGWKILFTDLRPSGKVKATDGRIFEATLKFGGFASKGESLKVISTEQGRLYCEKL